MSFDNRIVRSMAGELAGLDINNRLLLAGNSIVFDHLGTPTEFAVTTPYVINSANADATGETDSTAYFTRMAYLACGLSAAGVGTVGEAKPIFIAPGTYKLKAWNPQDANGYTLPVKLVAHRGSVKIICELSKTNESSGAIDFTYKTWVSAQKVQQLVTAISEGYAPATFGLASAASNDDTVSTLTVSSTTGYSPGDCAVICAKNNFPHTNSSSSKVRIAESFRILNVDATKIYVQGRLSFHNFYETEVYVTRLDTTRTFEASGIIFEGAPTTIGRTTATPSQLDHGVWGRTTNAIVSITRSSTTATVTTVLPHLLATGQYVHVTGADQENYNVTVAVTVTGANEFTYTLPTKNDANTTFGTAPGSVTTPATGTIVYADAFAPLDTAALGSAITVRNGVGVRLDNCEFRDLWTMGIRLYCSPEWRITNLAMSGLPNAGTNALAFGGGRLGYGVNVYGHSCNGVWEGGTVRNGRHAVTTGGRNNTAYTPTDDSGDAPWTTLGGPTKCLIKDVNSFDAWGIPFDVHEEGSDFTFMNCWAYNPQRGPQGGSYAGTGWQNRCRNMRILNCGQRGGQFGIRFAATEQLGNAATYGTSSTPAPLTYTVSSLTQAAGVATFVHGTGINGVNTGAHLSVGDLIRIRGAINDTDQGNYSVTVAVLTYTESTKTGTFTLPTKDDLGATFSVLPANASSPATGTITLQPIFRTQHVVQNFYCENLRKGKSGVVILDDQTSLAWKNKVLINGLTGRGTQCLINADGATVCDADNVVASQLIYDASSDQSGSVVGTQSTAIVHVGRMFLDVTDSINAPGIYPARMVETSTVTIGHLHLKQHPVYLACPRVFDDKDNAVGKTVGLGKLTYDNPGALNPTTHFAIIQIGRESHFTWLFGGEELNINCHTRTITNSVVTVAQRAVFNRFVLRRAGVILDKVALGTITVDVLLNGTTIFGASKITVAIGATSSDAAVPTYSKFLITDPSALTATVTSSNVGEDAKINNVSLTGYWV